MKYLIVTLGVLGAISGSASADVFRPTAPPPDWGTVPIGSDKPIDCRNNPQCGTDDSSSRETTTTGPRLGFLEIGRPIIPTQTVATTGPALPEETPEEEEPIQTSQPIGGGTGGTCPYAGCEPETGWPGLSQIPGQAISRFVPEIEPTPRSIRTFAPVSTQPVAATTPFIATPGRSLRPTVE